MKKPKKPGLKAFFASAAAAIALATGSAGLDQLPQDQNTGSQASVNIGDETYSAMLSPVDHLWRATLSFKSQETLDRALINHVADGQNWRVRELLKQGATADADRGLPLLIAIDTKNDLAATMLLTAGADAGLNRSLSMRMAMEKGNLRLTDRLLVNGARIDDANGGALIEAVRSSSAEKVDFLITRGADVRIDGNLALQTAASSGNKNLVNLLIRAGGNVDEALSNVGSNGDTKGVITLLESDTVDLEKTLPRVFTAAAASGNEKLVAELYAYSQFKALFDFGNEDLFLTKQHLEEAYTVAQGNNHKAVMTFLESELAFARTSSDTSSAKPKIYPYGIDNR